MNRAERRRKERAYKKSVKQNKVISSHNGSDMFMAKSGEGMPSFLSEINEDTIDEIMDSLPDGATITKEEILEFGKPDEEMPFVKCVWNFEQNCPNPQIDTRFMPDHLKDSNGQLLESVAKEMHMMWVDSLNELEAEAEAV